MQQDLKALEQRWGMALQTASFGVWDLDCLTETVHYSPQWKAMLGYGDDDRADSTQVWRTRVHPEDLQPMLAALTVHLAGSAPDYEAEFRLRAANGSWRWVLSRGRVVDRDENGRPLRAVGTLTDLTDRRQAEAMRLERDRAEAANRAKTEFLTRMSHELRTPLNAMLGFAQLLALKSDRISAAEQRSHVEQIEHAGWHLLGLIDDVLDLSRVESGQIALATDAVALAEVVPRMLAMMGPMAQQRGVRLQSLDLPPEAVVLGDSGRLKQVLSNLISNAIKYNVEGGSVTISVQAAAQGWALSVQDTGLGIGAAQMAHLFEPFNRLGRADSGVDGVGIGLVLTRWLVQGMGGTLTVHSREGAGSTFSVTLPAAAGAGAPHAANAA